jgi:restriction system protein
MAIPDYQTVMLPLLRFAADGQEHSLREAIEKLADHFGLSDEECKALLPSGRPRVKSTFYRRTLLACQRVEKRAFCESTKATTWLA